MLDVGRILVTGGNGLLGRALLARITADGGAITVAGRARPDVPNASDIRYFQIDGIDADTNWRPALEGCTTVIHLAAQVPLSRVSAERFVQVNDLGTGALVDQAGETGAKLFILASSVFAGMASTGPTALCGETPDTPYGRSKLAAEGHVERFAKDYGVGISLRFPLIYGARAQGNWHLLQRIAATGMPLPFGAANNRRSMIALSNAVDALTHLVAAAPAMAQSGVYTVSDGETVSLRDILILLRQGMGLPPRLFALPSGVLVAMLKSVGRARMADSLFADFTFDDTRFRQTFGWSPQAKSDEEIRLAGAAFKAAGLRSNGSDTGYGRH